MVLNFTHFYIGLSLKLCYIIIRRGPIGPHPRTTKTVYHESHVRHKSSAWTKKGRFHMTTTNTNTNTLTPEKLAALRAEATTTNNATIRNRFADALRLAEAAQGSTSSTLLGSLYGSRYVSLSVNDEGETIQRGKVLSLPSFLAFLRKEDRKERAADILDSVRELYNLVVSYNFDRADIGEAYTRRASKGDIKKALGAFLARYGNPSAMHATSAAVNALLATSARMVNSVKVEDLSSAQGVNATLRSFEGALSLVLYGIVSGVGFSFLATAPKQEKQDKAPTKQEAKQDKAA